MIYFLQRANGDIKIGTTENFRHRYRELVSEYGELKLLGATPGSYGKEAELHQKFWWFKVKKLGEWHRDCKEIRRYIAENAKLKIPTRDLIVIEDRTYRDLSQFDHSRGMNISDAIGLLLKLEVKS